MPRPTRPDPPTKSAPRTSRLVRTATAKHSVTPRLAARVVRLTKANGDESSNAARVLAFFREKLLAGELKPGDRLLPERELALALTVSRPVLREALRSLALLGLLEIQHGRGTFVRRADTSILGQALTLCLASDARILNDILQARIAIECQAIRLACVHATEENLVRIAADLDALAECLADPDRTAEADHRFHLDIVRASGSVALLSIYEAIGPLLVRSLIERQRETFHVAHITSRTGDAHREVLVALAQRDVDEAERRLRAHFAIGDELRRDALIASYQGVRQIPPGDTD